MAELDFNPYNRQDWLKLNSQTKNLADLPGLSTQEFAYLSGNSILSNLIAGLDGDASSVKPSEFLAWQMFLDGMDGKEDNNITQLGKNNTENLFWTNPVDFVQKLSDSFDKLMSFLGSQPQDKDTDLNQDKDDNLLNSIISGLDGDSSSISEDEKNVGKYFLNTLGGDDPEQGKQMLEALLDPEYGDPEYVKNTLKELYGIKDIISKSKALDQEKQTLIDGSEGPYDPLTPEGRGANAGVKVKEQFKSDPIKLANSDIQYTTIDPKINKLSIDGGIAYSKESLKVYESDGKAGITFNEIGAKSQEMAALAKMLNFNGDDKYDAAEDLAYTMAMDANFDGIVTPDEIGNANLNLQAVIEKAKQFYQGLGLAQREANFKAPKTK